MYAATKGGSEFLGNAYARMYGFEFVCVRYVGGLYGPSPTTMKATREQAILPVTSQGGREVPGSQASETLASGDIDGCACTQPSATFSRTSFRYNG